MIQSTVKTIDLFFNGEDTITNHVTVHHNVNKIKIRNIAIFIEQTNVNLGTFTPIMSLQSDLVNNKNLCSFTTFQQNINNALQTEFLLPITSIDQDYTFKLIYNNNPVAYAGHIVDLTCYITLTIEFLYM